MQLEDNFKYLFFPYLLSYTLFPHFSFMEVTNTMLCISVQGIQHIVIGTFSSVLIPYKLSPLICRIQTV